MKYQLLLIVAAITLLVACDSAPKLPKEFQAVALADSKQQVKIDERLLSECPPMEHLLGPKDVDNVKVVGAWAKAYGKCRDDKAALNKNVRQAFNLPAPAASTPTK